MGYYPISRYAPVPGTFPYQPTYPYGFQPTRSSNSGQYPVSNRQPSIAWINPAFPQQDYRRGSVAPSPSILPITPVRPTPTPQSNDNLAYGLAIGGAALAAALAGSILYSRRKKDSKSADNSSNKAVSDVGSSASGSSSTESSPIKADLARSLLDIKAFKIPPGLETPELRREKTVALVNAVFPKIIELYNDRDRHPHWQAELNQVFNEEFNKQICSDGRVLFVVDFERSVGSGLDVTNGYYECNLQDKRLADCWASPEVLKANRNNYAIDREAFSQASVHQFLPQGTATKPCFYLGEVVLVPRVMPFSPTNRGELYSLMLHEVNHLLYCLAKGVHQEIDDMKLLFEEGVFNHRYNTDGRLALERAFFKKKGISLPKDDEKIELNLRKYWNDLVEFAEEQGFSILDYSLVTPNIDEDFVKHGPQKMGRLMKSHLQLEYEGYRAGLERLNPDNLLPPPNSNIASDDFRCALRALTFRDMIRYFEEKLGIPLEKRYQFDFESTLRTITNRRKEPS